MSIQTISIKNSSAISKITFNSETNLVGVAFTSNPDKEYLYQCNNLDEVSSKIIDADETGKSVGKLIHEFRKNGTLEQIILEE